MLLLLRCSRLGRRHARTLVAANVSSSVRPVRVAGLTCFVSTRPDSGGLDENGLGKAGREKVPGWEKTAVAALKAYKEVHGDTLVSDSFVVPVGDDRWPREAWGYGLGKAVSKLRYKLNGGELSDDTKSELKQLEFVEGVAQFQWDTIIMPALRHFHKLHGHTDVPQDFVVPTGDASWPELSWGWSLGTTVKNTRSRKDYAEQVEASKQELRELFFCHELTTSERDWREMVLPSLKVFRDEFHHCIVDRLFKVPAMQPWPEKAWNMPLGRFVNMIRPGKIYVEQSTRDRDVLDDLGFAWDRDLSTYNELIIPSLEVFVAQRETCKMSQKFVVPACDPWPKAASGTRLGLQLYQMKYRGSFFAMIGRDVERLEKLGYTFQLSERAWKLRVVPLLDTYESLFGDRHVPEAFVVPSEAPWPKEMWGVRLGYIVARNSRLL